MGRVRSSGRQTDIGCERGGEGHTGGWIAQGRGRCQHCPGGDVEGVRSSGGAEDAPAVTDLR